MTWLLVVLAALWTPRAVAADAAADRLEAAADTFIDTMGVPVKGIVAALAKY